MKNLMSIIVCLISISAIAEENEWGHTNAWIDSGFSQTYVTLQDKSTKSFQAVIDDSPDGKKIVEFRFIDSMHDKCSMPASTELRDVIMKINGKRVKMKAGCKRVAIAKVLRYFAESKEGNSHIVNSFIKGDPVLINMQGYDVEIPAQGFVKAWENHGDDAI